MAANSDSNEAAGSVKKAWAETVSQLQTRLKDVEKIWNDTFTQVNARFQDAEKDVRDFVKKVESDGKERLEGLLGQLKDQFKVEELLGKLKTTDFLEQGARIGTETIERLGLVTKDELISLSEAVDDLAEKLKAAAKKGADSPSKKDFEALKKRVAAIEKGLKPPKAKKA